MSTGDTEMHLHPQAAAESPEEALADELEQINVDITEDNLVWIHTQDWELFLSPAEARELGEALIEAADDAEEGVQ